MKLYFSKAENEWLQDEYEQTKLENVSKHNDNFVISLLSFGVTMTARLPNVLVKEGTKKTITNCFPWRPE